VGEYRDSRVERMSRVATAAVPPTSKAANMAVVRRCRRLRSILPGKLAPATPSKRIAGSMWSGMVVGPRGARREVVRRIRCALCAVEMAESSWSRFRLRPATACGCESARRGFAARISI